MSNAFPWMQWFAGDWLLDKGLSRCSPATRGVWMDLLMHMHLDGRRGVLEGSIAQLGVLARCSPDAVLDALADLKNNGAAEITSSGDVTDGHKIVTVMSRRMQREYRQRVGVVERKQKSRMSQQCHGVEPESESYIPPQPPKNGGAGFPEFWTLALKVWPALSRVKNPPLDIDAKGLAILIAAAADASIRNPVAILAHRTNDDVPADDIRLALAVIAPPKSFAMCSCGGYLAASYAPGSGNTSHICVCGKAWPDVVIKAMKKIQIPNKA